MRRLAKHSPRLSLYATGKLGINSDRSSSLVNSQTSGRSTKLKVEFLSVSKDKSSDIASHRGGKYFRSNAALFYCKHVKFHSIVNGIRTRALLDNRRIRSKDAKSKINVGVY